MKIGSVKVKSWFLCLIIILIVAIVIIVVWPCRYDSVTTILLIRHAEKILQGTDPPLSIEGQNRAETLVHVVGHAGITGIYATQYLRTRQTVQPIADYLSLSITQVNANEIDVLVNQVLLDHKGEVVLIVGHLNTIPQIIEKLGGEPIPAILGNEYDNLFVITISRFRKTKVVNLKYGESS